ncbi:MAG TPA: MFS transporter, partial [Chloroflexota bacterium]|nr:MFS transporter [Chloroflexota bacterium]
TALRRRNFALVWMGGLASLTGDWALFAGLPLVVYAMTGSTLALGLTAIANSLPRLLLGSIAGVFVDRWDRRRTMFVTDVLLGLALLPMLLVTSVDRLWLLILCVIVESSVVQFYKPAEGALLPRLVPVEELVAANALNGLSVNLARLVGPALGALLVSLAGIGGVVVIDAGSFFVAALLLLLVRVQARPGPTAPNRDVASVWREWLAGLSLVRTLLTPRVIIIFAAIAGVGEGIMGTLFVAFATRVLQGGEFAFATLISAQAVGGLLGSLALGHFGRRIPPALLFGGGAVLGGLIDLLIFYSPVYASMVTPTLLIPVLLMVLVGGPFAAISAGYLTLAQTTVDDAYRGRLLGLLLAVQGLSGIVGMGLGGLLGDAVGIIPMLTFDSLAYVMGGSMVLITLGRAARTVRPACRLDSA